MAYNFGFYVKGSVDHLDALKTQPSIAGFVKISEDDMRMLCKRKTVADDASSLLVTDFQGYFEYEHQYSYPDLRGRGNQILAFDFYVPNRNLLVEFDGEQHFKPVRFNGISSEKAIKNFKKTKYNDALKNQYCNKNSIPLLRISYEKSKAISEILTDELVMADEGIA